MTPAAAVVIGAMTAPRMETVTDCVVKHLIVVPVVVVVPETDAQIGTCVAPDAMRGIGKMLGTDDIAGHVTDTVPPAIVVPTATRVMRGCTALARRQASPLPAEPPTVSIGGTAALGWHAVAAAFAAAAAAV